MKLSTISMLAILTAFTAGSAFAEEAATGFKGKFGGGDRAGHGPKIDTDGNGSISKDEWRAQGDKIFAKIDTDGNGALSKEEMKAHHGMKKERKGDRREKLEKLKERRDSKGGPVAEPAL
jgi:hypothetical protein